jgi:nucleoside-diphosphate-sugar epimerase
MRALVTGAAGFVGSHLCEHLLEHGDEVLGIDAFTDFYPRERKQSNIETSLGHAGFRLVETDLATADLSPLLEGIDVVYHLAAQPGVRPSWGKDFDIYVRQNIAVTQRLLEASIGRELQKFLYASSSSIYGNAEMLPTREDVLPQPISPYGVTKLAGEHLCDLYRGGLGIRAASLRLFTVYGPRQRPDMAFARLIDAAIAGETFEVYGDGEQTRDFTFVTDVVGAMRSCALSGWTGTANIGGGSRSPLSEAIRLVGEVCGGTLRIEHRGAQRGDARDTAADTSLAREAFGYRPRVALAEGLRTMAHWAKASV